MSRNGAVKKATRLMLCLLASGTFGCNALPINTAEGSGEQQVAASGRHNAVHQHIESQASVRYRQNAYVTGDYNLVVQIIGSMPPKQLESFLKDATERQALARRLGMTDKALQVFFKSTINEAVSLESLPKRLAEVAERYHHLKTLLERYNGNDPIIKELKQAALEALSELDWERASIFLEQAENRDIEVSHELANMSAARMTDAAETTAARAEAVLIGFQYILAGEIYKKAADRLPKGNEEKQAAYLSSSASNFYNGGSYSEAEPLYLEALAIRKQLGGKHPDVATSLDDLAYMYESQGRYLDAEPMALEALAIRRKQLGNKHPDVATSLNNLGILYTSKAQYGEAEKSHLAALKIRKEYYGNEHLSVASTLGNLGNLYLFQKRYDEAEPLQLEDLRISKLWLGDAHPDVATSLNNLAVLYKAQKRYDEAEPLQLEDLRISKLRLGDEHPKVAFSLNNLAILYKAQGRYDEAESRYIEAIAIKKKMLGCKHPSFATNLNNLANLYKKQRRYGEAEALYIKAIEILKNSVDSEHPDIKMVTANYARLKILMRPLETNN